MLSRPRHRILFTRTYGFGLAVFALLYGGWLHLNSHQYVAGRARFDASHDFIWQFGLGRGGVACSWGKNLYWFGPEGERSLTGIVKDCEWDPMPWFDGELATPGNPQTSLAIPLWPLPAFWALLFTTGMYRLHRQSDSDQCFTTH